MRLRALLERDASHFARELARKAYAGGLAVTQSDGSTRPIPVTATPIIVDKAELQRRVQLSALLSSATFKMAQASLRGADPERLLRSLSPLEREMAQATHARLSTLVTTRVDFFVGKAVSALEVNATIPAMQGYSDIAARAFLETVGGHVGLSQQEIAHLVQSNGRNAVALHEALLAGYAKERGGRRPERIGLLCRRNDSQLTEQRALAEAFRALGTEAEVLHLDELSGDDAVYAHGRRYDLIYRHVFVRRLEESDAPYVRGLLREVPGRRAVVLNPPCAQVEVKTTFVLLSEALNRPELAREASLSDEELEAIRSSVPWTRSFRSGPSSDPDEKPVAELVAYVAAHPERFVLKRAWDYGGKAVFVGAAAARGERSFEERVTAAFGRALTWQELCVRAALDTVGGGFVVQELVETEPEPHLLCTENGVQPAGLFVDFSAYASVGLETLPSWGGVCRGSVSQIVNIVGGGGVLPLLTHEVAARLEEAAAARGLLPSDKTPSGE